MHTFQEAQIRPHDFQKKRWLLKVLGFFPHIKLDPIKVHAFSLKHFWVCKIFTRICAKIMLTVCCVIGSEWADFLIFFIGGGEGGVSEYLSWSPIYLSTVIWYYWVNCLSDIHEISNKSNWEKAVKQAWVCDSRLSDIPYLLKAVNLYSHSPCFFANWSEIWCRVFLSKDKIRNTIIKQKMNVTRSLLDDIKTKQLKW